jgi:outer membrane murein-binding lipoprotein Lpp
MNQKTVLIVAGLIGIGIAGNAATQEYTRIKTRLEATQAKVDALTDELAATTKTIHAAIKSLAERFAKQTEAKPVEVVETKQPDPIKTVQPTIIMHSADETKGMVCGPCRAWIATEKAKWESVGWKIEIIKETQTKLGWPWFRIIDNDGTFDVVGPLTSEKLLAAKKAKR